MPVVLTNVSIAFGDRTVLDSVSANFPSATVSVIMGPSGAGKSTLLAAIAGYVRTDRGTIDTGGVPLSRIGFVFQGTHLIASRNALDNVAIGAMAQGKSYATAAHTAAELLAGLSLLHLRDVPVHRLSGGERQRLMILRAVAFKAPVLLADEPTASLDPASRDQVMRALRLAAEAGATVIASTHDEAVATESSQVLRLWG